MSNICLECKGKCKNKNNLKQQEAVRELMKKKNLGTLLPNECVTFEDGTSKCPYSK